MLAGVQRAGRGWRARAGRGRKRRCSAQRRAAKRPVCIKAAGVERAAGKSFQVIAQKYLFLGDRRRAVQRRPLLRSWSAFFPTEQTVQRKILECAFDSSRDRKTLRCNEPRATCERPSSSPRSASCCQSLRRPPTLALPLRANRNLRYALHNGKRSCFFSRSMMSSLCARNKRFALSLSRF